MSGWIIFWEIIILFSLISFIYMSIKILYKGLPELKSMFKNLDQRSQSSKKD
jgi:hypothetical protein